MALVVVLGVSVGMSNVAAAEPAGLVGHWTFDDGTGKDLSGNGNDAVLAGGTVYSLGEGQACIQFVPDADPLRIPASETSVLAISSGTVCFWLNTVVGRNALLAYDNGAIELNAYRGDFQARFQGEDTFRYRDLILDYDWPKYDMREFAFYGHPRASVDDSQWHLFAAAYDAEGKRIIGWRDGELISVVDLSAVEMEPLKREGLTEITTGKDFIGFMDDIRIYNRVLSDADMRAIYNTTQATYAGRRDTIPTEREVTTYRYRQEDHTLYQAWLQYTPRPEQRNANLFKNIVAQGNNSTVKTAASELCDAIASMLGFKPALHSKAVAGQRVILGTAETSLFIRKHADDLRLNRIQEDGFIIKTVDLGHTKALVIAGAVPAGVTFGTFDLIRRLQLGQDPGKLNVLENPQIPLRMVDHWSYFRGGFGDKWRGGGRNDSIYSWEELRTGDTKRIRDWVRMMASAGWNAICPSEVNWHYMDNYLDHLDEVEILAGILRDYGMTLYWSPSYHLALDQHTADQLYARVPDFGGYMMKLGSEKQNGDPRPPMVNRIADTLAPHGGLCLVRGFVYGNYRYTPEPYRHLIPHDIFAPEDGQYRENVVLVPKGSAGDWDYSAPIPAMDGVMKETLSGSELVIDKGFPCSWVEKWKWWLDQDSYRSGPGSFNKSSVHCIMGVAMVRPQASWGDSPLNMVNYYGLGRLAWNPDRSLDEIYHEWIVQTFGSAPQVLDTVNRILFMSDDVARKLYLYRGYRGIWIDKGDKNMVENKTPYAITPQGIGPASKTLQKRLIAQYAPGLREVYGDPLRGEEFLSSFHSKDHDYRLSIGRTLIEDVYGGMEEAVQIAQQMVDLWKTLAGQIDEHRFQFTLNNLVDFVADAQGDRDAMAAAFEAHTGRKRETVLARLTPSGLASVGTFNVRHYGAVGDGTANDAPAINRAIAACHAAGGGTVFVPSGIYTSGSVHLQSNVTLALDKGAVLKAMPGIMDPWEPNPNDQGLMDSAYYHWEGSLIWGKNLRNVKIYGPGTLDGSALTRSSKVPKGIGDKAIALKLCKNIEIRNLNIREGGHYAILATGCARMLIDNVTIKTSRDGINLSQCSDVEIANCHIDAVRFEDGYPAGGDDAIKLGSDLSLGKARISENISVRNCFLASGCNAIQFGSETMAPFRNIRFENIRIVRAGKAGISITSNDGSVIEGLHFLDISMEKTFAPIFIKLSDVARVPAGAYQRGSIRNIRFENIRATDCYSYFKGREMPCVIWGKADTPISGIAFKNVSIIARGGHPVADADVLPAENDERFPRHLGTLPAYGWYLRHVKDIRFTDCEFRVERADGRPAFVINDGETVVLKNTTLPIGSKCSSRINVRNQAKDLAILNCIGMSDVKETVSNRNY
jgi:alpha-glucuronidase/polygalacturonase|tara:strand:+ start:672 stop:4808 length:4137 start_codon:yes stop_codon:yes gene_type:complete